MICCILPDCEQTYAEVAPIPGNPVTADKVLHHIASYKMWDLKSPDVSVAFRSQYCMSTLLSDVRLQPKHITVIKNLSFGLSESDLQKQVSCFLILSSCFYSSQMEPELTHLYHTLRSNHAVFTQIKIPLKTVWIFFCLSSV